MKKNHLYSSVSLFYYIIFGKNQLINRCFYIKIKFSLFHKGKKEILSLFLLCLFCSIRLFIFNYKLFGNHSLTSIQDRSSIIRDFQEDISTSNGYQLVDPINITTGSDWDLYTFITGNGSGSNPYIIENVEIIGNGIKTIVSGDDTLLNTSDVGIFIETSASFIIRNCKISHKSIGIHLSFGFSSGDKISNVEISDCSIGIYSIWYSDLNISNCYIHDCSWVSIIAKININYFLDYGGIGLMVRSSGGIIENCRIEDCSIGMMAGRVQVNHYNEFINCGFVPDYLNMYITDYDITNTVNGKPIGIFWGVDNLVFSNASLYGQLIFTACDNLTLSNIHISQPCSIAIQLLSLGNSQTTYLKNIICENQELALYIQGENIIGENLYAKNCKAGFSLNGIKNSKFTKVMTDNTDVPIYATTTSNNFTIEIEQSTKFYLYDWFAWYGDVLEVEPGNDISMSYINELGVPGYEIQFNNFGTYQLNLTLPLPYLSRANITIISVPRYVRPDIFTEIRNFPFFWYWSIIIIGLLVLIEYCRRFYQK
ncbi:MAG: right-handed parallel beta-helix repeat-containing protein [Promethearchaeota archaeon]|nr:MAG: right-handed parallel beta-helix repeat-containing protein [Candidatus Lokiarchaeota archaeon]